MVQLSEVPRTRNIFVLGDSGTGKTHLLGTLCNLMPTVLCTADPNGLDTLDDMGVKPKVVLVNDWSRAWDYVQQLGKLAQEGAMALALDDFGGIQEVLERRIQLESRGKTEEQMPAANRNTHIRAQLVRGDRRLIQSQYMQIATATDSWLYEVLRLPYRVRIVTNLVDLRPHPRTTEDHLFPNITGNLRYVLAAKFSLVLNTFVEQRDGTTHWCATSQAHPRIPTKDRYGEPRTWINPTAERLMRHINRKEESSDKETQAEQQIGVGISRINDGRN